MKVSDFTLLLIEDDPDDVLLLQRAFAKASLVNPVRVLRDGEAAVNYLAGNGEYADRARSPLPSLILLDLSLPRMTGFEVLEWMLGQTKLQGIPIIVLTSSREPKDVERAYKLGASSFLVKPMGFDNLLEMIQALKIYWVILNKTPLGPPS